MQVQRKSVPWRKFGSIGGRDYINTGSFKKYIQTLVRRTSSDFKTSQSSLKNTRLRLVFFNSSRCLKIGESPPPTRVWTITSKAFLQTKCWACSITGLNIFLFVNHIQGKIYLYIIRYEGKLWLHIVSKKW